MAVVERIARDSREMHPDFYRDYLLLLSPRGLKLVGRGEVMNSGYTDWGDLETPETVRVRIWGGMSRAQIEEAIFNAMMQS